MGGKFAHPHRANREGEEKGVGRGVHTRVLSGDLVAVGVEQFDDPNEVIAQGHRVAAQARANHLIWLHPPTISHGRDFGVTPKNPELTTF